MGENEHAAQGGDHRRAVERDEVGVVLGNDAVVVGELALDQAAGEVVALRGDDGVATVEADGDVAHFFLQDVAHDVGRLLVEDERGGGVGLDVEQAGARKFATVRGHHGEASALKSKNTPFITGRRGSSAAAKSARLMPEKRRAASAPRVEISPSNSGVRGYSWAFCPTRL